MYESRLRYLTWAPIFFFAACKSHETPRENPEPPGVLVGCTVRRRVGRDLVCEASGPLHVVDERKTYDLPAGTTRHQGVRIEPYEPPRWVAAAKAARAAGKFEEANAAIPTAPGASRSELALRAGQRGRNALAQSDMTTASTELETAIRENEAEGRFSEAVDDAYALAYALSERGREYARARTTIERVQRWLVDYPEGRAREPYYRAIIASETGDLRTALHLFTLAEELATFFLLPRLARDARTARVSALARLGRAEEASALAAPLRERAASETGCERLATETNLAYVALAGADVGIAQQHAALASAQSCEDKALTATALGNLAAVELRRGDPEAAAKTLARIGTTARLTDRLLQIDLEGQIALARGRSADAAGRFAEECTLADAAAAYEEAWRCRLGIGEATGDPNALRAAEDALDRWSTAVPLGEGRATFLADRERSHQLLVEALVRGGHANEAFREVARPLRRSARALRVARAASETDRAKIEDAVGAYERARAEVDTSTNWTLDAKSLAAALEEKNRRLREAHRRLDEAQQSVFAPPMFAPAPALPAAALALGLLRTPKGTLLVAQYDGETRTATGEAVPWLASVLRDWGAAKRILVWSELDIDVHAIPFDGAPLGARIPVEYVFGFGPRPQREAATAPAALVVGDPGRNLPAARAEAEGISRVLRERGFDLLAPPSNRSDLFAALGKVRLFHYAGHAAFSPAEDGLESGLELGFGRIVVGDLLTLAQAPETIVLSACEAGRAGHATAGIAHAFLAAGATVVLAPSRPVGDEEGRHFIERLYDAWNRDGPATAYQHALIAGPSPDALAYRFTTSGW